MTSYRNYELQQLIDQRAQVEAQRAQIEAEITRLLEKEPIEYERDVLADTGTYGESNTIRLIVTDKTGDIHLIYDDLGAGNASVCFKAVGNQADIIEIMGVNEYHVATADGFGAEFPAVWGDLIARHNLNI